MSAVYERTDEIIGTRFRVLVDEGVDRSDGHAVIWIGNETIGRAKSLTEVGVPVEALPGLIAELQRVLDRRAGRTES